MSSVVSFVTLCALGTPNHSRTSQYKIRSLSRREVVISLGFIPLFMSGRAAGQHLPSDAKGIAKLLRERCNQFASLIHPVRSDALLWRGADSGQDFAIRSPPPDLLLEDTYGAEGASFFKDLDRFLAERQADSTVLPSRAHVGTGDPRVASNWGTPVSVWPIGELRFAYWRDSSLIYKENDTLEKSRNRGDQLVFGQGLRDALIHGKEVMFEAGAFFEMSETLTAAVLEILDGSV